MENPEKRWSDFRNFVGRQRELALFKKLLSHPKDAPRTLLIQASGGQGKTWLIKKMLLSAFERDNFLVLAPDKLVDMYSTSNRHLEGVLKTLADRLCEQAESERAFEPYKDAWLDLEKARKQEEYSQEELNRKVKELADIFRGCLQKLAEKQTIVLAFDTFENVQGSEVGEWILSDNGLQMPNVVCLVGTRNALTSDEEKVYPAVQLLPLSGLSDDEAVQLYCLYTRNAETTDEFKAFIKAMNKKAGQNPLMLGLAIMWIDLSQNTPEAMEKLSQVEFEREIVSWLSPKWGAGSVWFGGVEHSEQMRQALVLMAYLNRRFNFFFLKKLADSGYIQLDEIPARELWNNLENRIPDLFYVKERPEGEIQLHDKLAEMLRKYMLADTFNDRTGDSLRRFAQDVEKWYEEFILESANKDELYAEQLAYCLRSDIYSDCYKILQTDTSPLLSSLPPNANDIIDLLEGHRRRRSDVLARLIINEAKTHLIQQFTAEEQYKIYRLLGQIARQSHLLEAAQDYWKNAYDIAAGLGKAAEQVEALIGLHNCTYQTDPRRSITILNNAHKICEGNGIEKFLPKVLYELGFTYSRLGDLSKSNQWFKKAKEQATRLEDAEMMPTILNDEGYNYSLMGDIARATILIRASRKFRLRVYNNCKKRLDESPSEQDKESLKDKAADAALKLGMSYSTLGDLARFTGKLDEATGRYSEALKIFQEAKSTYWQARMYFSRGEAYRRRAVAHQHAGRIDQCKKFDQDAESSINISRDLCQQFGFSHESVTADRRLARLYHDRMFRTENPKEQIRLWYEAKVLFRKALRRAEVVQDTLEILENLTEIAFLADDYLSILKSQDQERFKKEQKQEYQSIENFQKYIEGLQTAKDKIYQFPVFQHLLEIEQAAYHFVLEEYEPALQKYIDGYVGMAKIPGYGTARYIQHLDHLVNQLQKLNRKDKKLCAKWFKSFLNAWKRAGLMEKFPELPQEIEMLKDTAFLDEYETE